MKETITEFLEQNGLGQAVESTRQFLSTPVFENTLADCLISAFILISLILVLSIVKKIFVSKLREFAEKTVSDFHRMIVDALSKIKSPTVIIISVYVSTLSLKLTPPLVSLIKYALVLILTIQAVQILQVISNYGVSKTYRRARPKDPAYE